MSAAIATSAAVHPAFRARLLAALPPTREGALHVGDHDAPVFNATVDGASLAVLLDTKGIVRAARHSGGATPEQRAALDVFCGLAEGLPLREAAEHGAIHLLDRLRDPAEPRPVAGIVTPRNAGDVFRLVERLIRDVAAQAARPIGQTDQRNMWNPRLHPTWAEQSQAEQAALLKTVIDAHLRAEGLPDGAIWVYEIENSRRVVVDFASFLPPEVKPALLLRLERRVRDVTASRIELYVGEMKDRNEIRRL